MSMMARVEAGGAGRRRLLVSTALVSCVAATMPIRAQVLPDPTTATLNGATTTNFDSGFGLRVDIGNQNRVIDWTTFNVGSTTSAREEVNFVAMGAAQRAVLNRVTGADLSAIYGKITSDSNVTVWLSNPNGITFGPTGSFSGGGLVITTAAIDQANFLSANAKLLTDAGSNPIILQSGTGALAADGAIVVVAQRIESAKSLTADRDTDGSGDVVLVAARDVTLPNAFGSPLGITITEGTTVGTAKIDASGAIRGASVQLLGASKTAATEALLQVTGAATTLQATRATDGKVVIAAGAAVTDVGFVLAPTAPGDTDATATIALAGTIGGVANNVDTIVAGNSDIGGTALLRAAGNNGDAMLLAGGAITGTLSLDAATLTVTAGATQDVTLGSITTVNDFSLSTSGDIETAAITVTDGSVTLATSAGSITTTGVINAGDEVQIDASADVDIARANAGVGASGSAFVEINAGTSLTFAGGSADGDIRVNTTAGLAKVTGIVTADDDYIVIGDSVELGTAGVTPITQSADNLVRITADAAAGTITGLGKLTLQSNSGGNNGGAITRRLQLEAGGAIDFGIGTTLLGGSDRESALVIDAGGDIALGTVSALRISQDASQATPGLTNAGDIGAVAITTTEDLRLTSTNGAIAITGQARSTGDDVDLTGATIDVGSVRADGAIDITATAGAIDLGNATAGDDITISNTGAANGNVTVTGALETAGNRDILVESVNSATLTSVTLADDVRVDANNTATVAGNVTANGNYRVSGNDVTLGAAAATVVQKAKGSVLIESSAGDITGLGTLTLQSNSDGLIDLLDVLTLTLDASGGKIDFAGTTRLLGGDDLQSLVSLSSTGTYTLGSIAAKRLAPTVGGVFDVTTAFTAGDITTANSLAIRTTAALQLGNVEAETGNLALTGLSVAATGARASDGNLTVTATGGAITVGTAFADGDATISNRPGAVFDVGVTSLTTTSGGDGIIRSTGAATLGTADTAGDLTVDAAAAATVSGNATIDGDYRVNGSNVILGNAGAAAQRADGLVTITAATGSIVGRGSLVLASNSDNAGNEALTLRAEGAGGIDFAAGSSLIGGTTVGGVANRTSDVLVLGPVSTLALGIVNARTLQGITTADAVAGPAANPRELTVTGDAILRGAVTLAGGFRLTSTTDGIIGQGAIQTGNAVVLRAADDIALVSVTATAGNIDIATTAGDVRGLTAVSAPQAAFAIGTLNPSGNIDLTLPDNAIIGTIVGSGDVRLRGDNLRLGGVSATGNIDIATTGALTGNAGSVAVAPITGPNLTANGAAASIIVAAGGVGQPQTAQLGTVSAAQDVTITADAIAVDSVTATGGTVALNAASSLVAGTAAGDTVTLTALGNAAAGPATPDYANDILDTRFGATNLTATANGSTIVVVSDSIAQIGTVTAGTTASAGVTNQIDISGAAVAIGSIVARNGEVLVTSTGPLYVGQLTAANGVYLSKLGLSADGFDELRLGRSGAVLTGTAAGSTGTLLLVSGSDIRLGTSITAQRGDIAISAARNVTGFASAGATGLVPGFLRGSVEAQAGAATVTIDGNQLLLGTIAAGSGLGAATPDQVRITGKAIDVATATARDGAIYLTATEGLLTLGTGNARTLATLDKQMAGSELRVTEQLTAGGDISITSATNVRLAGGAANRFVRSTAGDIEVIATGDVTGAGGADTFQPGITIATLGGAAVSLIAPGDLTIGTVTTPGDVTLGGANIRLGSATTTAGNIDFNASKALTGLAPGAFPLGTIAGGDLFAQGVGRSVTVTAGGAGNLRQAQLGTVRAGLDIDVTADRIAINDAMAGGTATLAAGSVLALGTISAGDVVLTGAGGTDITDPVADYANDVLDTRFDGTVLEASGSGRTITVSAGTIAQIDSATAGLDGAPGTATNAIDIGADATTLGSARAFNGGVYVKAFDGPLYVGTVAAGHGVQLAKTGVALVDAAGVGYGVNNELRVLGIVAGTAAGAIGDVRIGSATNARIGTVATTNGDFVVAADAAITGLAAAPAADGRPEAGYGLIAVDIDGAIGLAAGTIVQTGDVIARTDIDVTGGGIAWLGGDVTATGGHYRVTGGSVVLGQPGGVMQSAATDVAIRSTAGDIIGGSGLVLTSDRGNSGVAANSLVLDSFAGIQLADGLGGDTVSVLSGGGNGASAAVGIRLGAGGTLQLGNVAARALGDATGPLAPMPANYAVGNSLTTAGAIMARDIATVQTLAVNNVDTVNRWNITIDSARSTTGGIDLRTSGDIKGHDLGGGLFQRTTLTAFGDIFTRSGFGLFDTVDAGRAIDMATGGSRLDVEQAIARGGSASLSGATSLLVDSVDATGNVVATAVAGNVADTAGGAAATFLSRSGGVAIASNATTLAGGDVRFATAIAQGATAGSRDISIDGRTIGFTSAVAQGGSIAINASQVGAARNNVSVDAVTLMAARDIAVSVGLGSGASPAADNGSMRIGSASATAGTITLTALDGDVTGRSGVADGLDAAHARLALAAGGDVAIVSGGLTQLGVVTATGAIRITAGDAVTSGTRLDSGAIDIARADAGGLLALTAQGRTAAPGTAWNGDIRIGATAAGQPQAGVMATTATTAMLATLGDRGDIIIASALDTAGAAAIDAIANARLAGGDAVPFTDHFVRAGAALAITARSGDITGLALAPAATDGRPRVNFARADLTAPVMTIRADNGAIQIGTVIADASGSGDQLIGNARTIDIVDAQANGGNVLLTATAGDIRILTASVFGDTTLSASGNSIIDSLSSLSGNVSIAANEIIFSDGTIGGNATLIAATNARIGSLETTTGSISVTATGGDITGLANGGLFDRTTLASGGTGSITLSAANGNILGGAITAGVAGAALATDQLVATARSIDITTATANNGNLKLTATAGDVIVATIMARRDATIMASALADLDSVITTSGALLIDAGDIVLGDGDVATNAVLLADNSARIGRLATVDGNILVTATSGDITGLDNGGGTFDRATIGSGGDGTITLTALSAGILAGDVLAGVAGAASGIDQLTARAGRIDITTATAGSGNLLLVANAGDVRLATGTAAGNATVSASELADIEAIAATAGDLGITAGDIVLVDGHAGNDATLLATNNARIAMLETATGNIGITATGGDITGLTDGGIFDRAIITSGGTGTIALTAANGTILGGAVTAGIAGATLATDQLTATARSVDITTVTAANGNLRLAATAGDLRLVSGTARTDAIASASGTANIDSFAATTGDLRISAGGIILGTGNAADDATLIAVNSARIGNLSTATGDIAVTATNGDITGLAAGLDFGRAVLTSGGNGTVALTAINGSVLAGDVTAGLAGPVSAIDQLVVTAGAIDITMATSGSGNIILSAGTGNVRLVTAIAAGDATVSANGTAMIDAITATAGDLAITAGDIVLASGDASGTAMLRADDSARIGALSTGSGLIAVAATNGDITGLADGDVFGRATLTSGGNGTITLAAMNGSIAAGDVTAGIAGAASGIDQLIATAEAIDISNASAGSGNIVLTATAGDVALGTGTAAGDAIVSASATAAIDTITAMAGDLTITAGDIALGTGMAGNAAVLRADDSARIGVLSTGSGLIAITATNGDITGLADGDVFGRATLTSGGNGTITLGAVNGAIRAGDVMAGIAGAASGIDQLVADAEAIDISNASAGSGNIVLTATAGYVALGTGTAAGDAIVSASATAAIDTITAMAGDLTITAGDIALGTGMAGNAAVLRADDSARIGVLSTGSGLIAVTATNGDITGLADGDVFGRATLTSGGNGTVTLSAVNGAIRAGDVMAGIAGAASGIDQLVANAEAIDISNASAGSGNIVLAATAGDVTLGTGMAAGNASVTASGTAAIDAITASAGALGITAGDIVLGSGDAATMATLLAANSARIGRLTTVGGDIFVTATGGDITGLADGDSFGRAVLRSGGNGVITLAADNGRILGDEVSAGAAGAASGIDQLVANARAIDITTASAGRGNMLLTATAGDVRIGTATAAGGVIVNASATAALDMVTASAGDLVVNGGDIVIGAGSAGGLAELTAANSARIGSLRATGPVTVTATMGDISGLADGDSFGRADIASGGTAALTLTATNGMIRGGAVTAGDAGTATGVDQLIANARGIDITTATASNGNLLLAASSGDVVIGTGAAAGRAMVRASGTADLGAITASGGTLDVTATGIVIGTGSASGNATLAAMNTARVGDLASSGGNILVTATSGDIEGRTGGDAVFRTAAAGRTITLTADSGRLTLGAVTANAGDIVMTARDARINGAVTTSAANTIRIVRGTATAASETRIGSVADDDDTRATLNLSAAEINRLNAGTVQIVSAPLAGKTGVDVRIGILALDADTGATQVQFLGTGAVAMTGTISDAGAAVARTLQIGGDSAALPTDAGITTATPLALRIDATIRDGEPGTAGTPIIALPSATVDLRGARITFAVAKLITEIGTRTSALTDAAAADRVAIDYVSNAGSDLYRTYGNSNDVFLTARLLQVSYSSFALFQNTAVPSIGGGTVLGTPGNSTTAPGVLELRSLGATPVNSFALFGSINGFTGRAAGSLTALFDFADGDGSSRVLRINQPSSRLNGCVIGSPDRGCLVTDIAPPTIRFLDERQLQLFGVAEDLTVPFDPLVGTANETLIGDITTTGSVTPADCAVPGTPGCPVPGERP